MSQPDSICQHWGTNTAFLIFLSQMTIHPGFPCKLIMCFLCSITSVSSALSAPHSALTTGVQESHNSYSAQWKLFSCYLDGGQKVKGWGPYAEGD